VAFLGVAKLHDLEPILVVQWKLDRVTRRFRGVPKRLARGKREPQYNLVSWALNSFGVPLDDFLPGAGP
jgi:hypothetical protein